MMTTKRTIEAIATHEGKWWEISFMDDDLDTVTSTRKLDDVQAMAADAAALWLDVDPETISVHVTVTLPEPYRSSWDEAQAKAAAAREAEAEAAQLRRQVITNLRADGYTLAEAGTLLGLSKGRIHQLAQESTSHAATR
jgi:DNA-directed RNA polymerase specialized sigma24 family protein